MRLICAMLVGPGEADRYLERTMLAAREWADGIVIYGDGPDADTRLTICQHADYSQISPHCVFPQSESMARNSLLYAVDRVAHNGDIIVMLDADEELRSTEDDHVTDLLVMLSRDSHHDAWSAEFKHLWADDGSVHRVDGLWQPSVGHRIYRYAQGQRIPSKSMACSPIPSGLRLCPADPWLRILHWGYARPADRRIKYERYTQQPGHNPAHIESILRTPRLAPVGAV